MKPRPLCYNGAILKKSVIVLGKVELCLLQLGCSKEEERLRGVGSLAKAAWMEAAAFGKRAVVSSPAPAWQRSPPVGQRSPSLTQDVLQALAGKVGAFLPLAGMQ